MKDCTQDKLIELVRDCCTLDELDGYWDDVAAKLERLALIIIDDNDQWHRDKLRQALDAIHPATLNPLPMTASQMAQSRWASMSAEDRSKYMRALAKRPRIAGVIRLKRKVEKLEMRLEKVEGLLTAPQNLALSASLLEKQSK